MKHYLQREEKGTVTKKRLRKLRGVSKYFIKIRLIFKKQSKISTIEKKRKKKIEKQDEK